jgi:hypothetical protein
MTFRLSVLVLALSLLTVSGFAQPQGSPDEQKAAQAIAAAPDAAKKLKAGEDFIKKYPKSKMRAQIARDLSNQIGAVSDPAQKVTLAQEFQQAFTDVSEQEMIVPVAIEGLTQAQRIDEAFTAGSAFLAKNPDSIEVLIELLSTGAEQAKAKNPKYATQSLQYGKHAIELIDAGKKPTDIDDAAWTKYKTETVPSLYQSIGLLSLVTGDHAQAVANYTKASELAPADAFNVLMLAGLLNDDYQAQAKKYQGMPNGAAKDEELKKTQALMDKVIDSYARAVALSENNAAYANVRQQYLQDLESYYKYRHNGSTAGMQELINKYKPLKLTP